MAAIFFSHASDDDGLADEIVLWLGAQGFEDIFYDHKSLKSGDKWTEMLRQSLQSCRVVLCLITPRWLISSECFGEFNAGWYSGRRIIPLLCISGVQLDKLQQDRLSRVLLEDQGIDIALAGAPDKLDFDNCADLKESFLGGLRASGALTRVGLDPLIFLIDGSRDPEGNLQKPPFPGLESFGDTDADAAIFFGRSSEIAQILEELREFRANGDQRAYAQTGRAYVIQGASGSGKSSVLKAGVLPRLRREHGWIALRSFRPGTDPLFNFAEALSKSAEHVGSRRAPGVLRDNLLKHWRSVKVKTKLAEISTIKYVSFSEKHAILKSIDTEMLQALRSFLDMEIGPLKENFDRPFATVLISIDQGEELINSGEDNTEAFVDYIRASLLQGSIHRPAQYCAVFTIRTDSFQEIQLSPRLDGVFMKSFDLRPLPIYRFAEAIELPAARCQVVIDQALVEMLMEEAGSKDALPLLAFTLHRLWQQYEQEQHFKLVHYESLGKLTGIVEDAAERALRGFDPGARQGPLSSKVSLSRDLAARHTFIPALAQINEKGDAIRQVAVMSDFDEDSREIIGWFEKWRLVIVDNNRVEVAHEALFRAWPRFQSWLEPEKTRLEILRNLEIAAYGWHRNNKSMDYIIHSGRRLHDIRNISKDRYFNKQIEQKFYVKEYLKLAKKLDSGWQYLYAYCAFLFAISAVFYSFLFLEDYVFGFDGSLEIILNHSPVMIVAAMISVFVASITAVLRHINIKYGYQYDIFTAVCACLILIIVAVFIVSDLFFSEKSIPDNYMQGLARGNPALGLLSRTALYSMASYSYVLFFMFAASFCCLVLQVALMLTIPLRFIGKIISRIGLAVTRRRSVA